MHQWKVASALCKPNSCTWLATQPGMPPGTTCSPTSKDTTIVSGFIPLSGISPPKRQSAKPLNPMSTKSGEGQIAHLVALLDRRSDLISNRDRQPHAGDESGREHEPERSDPECCRVGSGIAEGCLHHRYHPSRDCRPQDLRQHHRDVPDTHV